MNYTVLKQLLGELADLELVTVVPPIKKGNHCGHRIMKIWSQVQYKLSPKGLEMCHAFDVLKILDGEPVEKEPCPTAE